MLFLNTLWKYKEWNLGSIFTSFKSNDSKIWVRGTRIKKMSTPTVDWHNVSLHVFKTADTILRKFCNKLAYFINMFYKQFDNFPTVLK